MSDFENRPILLKRAMVLPNNILICTYCNQIGHDNKECWQYETEMVNLKKKQNCIEDILHKSGIPEKYWKSQDPLKEFLMNNSVNGHRMRMYLEKRTKFKNIIIYG
jgi:hypothetical protein